MATDQNTPTVWGFIKGFGKFLIGLTLVLQGVIGLFVLIMFVSIAAGLSNGLFGGKSDTAEVPQDAALLINPNGVLVEQVAVADPFEQALQEAFGAQEPSPIGVHDLVRGIRAATEDDRIKGIVLDLGRLSVSGSGASKLHYLSAELDKFKASGKKIYAVGDYYSHEQYILAARADEIHMHDMGNLFFLGYGRYRTYYKSLLEKLKITTHVFRVGTFKSAVEPFLRDDMSPEAKDANAAYLSTLWRDYGASIEKARGLESGAVTNFADNPVEILRSAGGDAAKAALELGLVDKLGSRKEQLEALKEIFGADEKDEDKPYKRVDYSTYLASLEEEEDGDAPNIAVVTAAGVIVDGKAPVGEAAGGDTIAGYLKKAREDDDVKAVVLRVDSPGGSAFASEIIRDQVLALKEAGKPVVVSMGSLAASGGYWISAPADEIWAMPTTITGSIGIFGIFNTFENAAAHWGVYVDGVGTNTLSSLYGTGLGALNEPFSDVMQQVVEKGYMDFLEVVADGRDMTTENVDKIGQGRVWIGETAKDLGLVDKIGTLDDAVAAAARLAELEEYDQVDMIETLSPIEALFGDMAARTVSLMGLDKAQASKHGSTVSKIINGVDEQVSFWDSFNDPNAIYVRCLECAE